MSIAPLVEADSAVEEDYYLLWRMEQGVAEGCTEIPKGKLRVFFFLFPVMNLLQKLVCFRIVAEYHNHGKRMLGEQLVAI